MEDKHFIKPLDPRAGLWLLVMGNIGMFCQKNVEQGSMLAGVFLVLLVLYGHILAAFKSALLIVMLRLLLWYVFPFCPAWVNMIFPVLANYTLRMMPCILSAMLFVKASSMQRIIAAMRALHLPQGFIVSVSTTMRYFPAIREEFTHIKNAMKLQNIPWMSRVECTVVPLMMSAVNTSDEIAAAAVARGIENPCKKSSAVELRFTVVDAVVMLLGTVAIICVIWLMF